jgi:hypothetical protein
MTLPVESWIDDDEVSKLEANSKSDSELPNSDGVIKQVAALEDLWGDMNENVERRLHKTLTLLLALLLQYHTTRHCGHMSCTYQFCP